MSQQPKAKMNIPMCAACVLLCLTLFSIHLTSGLYAKYIAKGTGSDEARVIRFNQLVLTEDKSYFDQHDGKWMIIPGVNIPKQATVNFGGSESDTYIIVEVTLSKQWNTIDNINFNVNATHLNWTIAEGWTYLKNVANINGSITYVYYKYLDSNTPLTSAHIIKNGVINVSDSITKKQISSLKDIFITFRATAVQAGGFENATDAYTSIAAKG